MLFIIYQARQIEQESRTLMQIMVTGETEGLCCGLGQAEQQIELGALMANCLYSSVL